MATSVEIIHETHDVFRLMLMIHNCMHGLGIPSENITVRSSSIASRPPDHKFWPTIARHEAIRWNETGQAGMSVSSENVIDWKRYTEEPESSTVGHVDIREQPSILFTVCTGEYEGKRLLLRAADGDRDLGIATYLITDNWSNYLSQKDKIATIYICPCWNAKRLQRTIKHMPQWFLPDSCQRSMYVDGNIEFSARAAAGRLKLLGEPSAVAMICYAHPTRKDPMAEGREVIRLRLEFRSRVDATLQHMRDLMGNEALTKVGLTDTSILIRDHNDETLKLACAKMATLVDMCIRDQVGFDACMAFFTVNFRRLPNKERNVVKHRHVNASDRTLK
jgi:hypothetical protein